MVILDRAACNKDKLAYGRKTPAYMVFAKRKLDAGFPFAEYTGKVRLESDTRAIPPPPVIRALRLIL